MTTPGARVTAVGLLTGWGEGIETLPDDARIAAAGRTVIPMATPDLSGERFRRATRECLLGVAATGAALRACGLSRSDISGDGTALCYVTAGAYGAANRAFVEAASTALHFPYTAPSAVPAEVAIEFGMRGSYVILIGGGTATLEALAQASRLIARGAARRALVLAVETFVECADLFARGRRLMTRPLVEAAACAVLEPATHGPAWCGEATPTVGATLERLVSKRAGETLACGPLIALALAAGRVAPLTVTGQWRGRRAGLEWASREET